MVEGYRVQFKYSAPGAIVVEWNAGDPPGRQAAVGAWDTHVR